jgi:superfamily I DNA and/or RNA helicase
VIVRLLVGLQADSPRLHVAVITFYAAQRALLGRELARRGVGPPVEVHTVDSYQVGPF